MQKKQRKARTAFTDHQLQVNRIGKSDNLYCFIKSKRKTPTKSNLICFPFLSATITLDPWEELRAAEVPLGARPNGTGGKAQSLRHTGENVVPKSKVSAYFSKGFFLFFCEMFDRVLFKKETTVRKVAWLLLSPLITFKAKFSSYSSNSSS